MAKEEMTISTNSTKEAKIVYKNDVKTIEYTEKAKHGKAGKREVVHAILAEKLSKKGVAKIVG